MALFDHSRMALINVQGESRPPYVVLTSQDLLEERPELRSYQVDGNEKYTIWAGNSPAAVYVSFPDERTFLRLAGDPNPDPVRLGALTATTSPPGIGTPSREAFDPEVFDSTAFETGTVPSDIEESHPEEPGDVSASQIAREAPHDGGAKPIITEAVGLAAGGSTAQAVGESIIDAAAWTGVRSRSQQLISVRRELGVAQLAVGALIEGLDQEGNGGPRLDEHEDAVDALRTVHKHLGDLLSAIDRGVLTDELGESFAADIARFCKRAVNDLRCDPSKYTLSLTVFALLSACGAANWGSFIAASVIQISPNKAR